MVGAGRLATNLALALHESGHQVAAVYSRTIESAQRLACQVGAMATSDIAALPRQADAFIVAVKDDALANVVSQLEKGREDCCFFHTAGSVPMAIFGSHRLHGVFYPMQTFSMDKRVDFKKVHIFIEGNSPETLQLAQQLAQTVSPHVHEMTSEQRRQLHLAAVFGCNFANHCFALSARILERQGLPFDVMLPLVDETTAKVHTMHPRDAQTGPAARSDENVMGAQRQMLADEPLLQQIYTLMSESIQQTKK